MYTILLLVPYFFIILIAVCGLRFLLARLYLAFIIYIQTKPALEKV